MAFLIGMSDSIKGQKFEIKRDRTTLGRGHINDIVLNDGSVSSQHCYISNRGNRYILHDLNSTNGTRVNFDQITEAELQPKHVLQIGSLELMFDGESSEFSELTKTTTIANPDVIVVNAPSSSTPKSFSSISPFGSRREEHKALWLTVIAVLALLAVIGIGFFVYRLFF